MKDFFYCTAGLFFLLMSLQIIIGVGLVVGAIASNWDLIQQAINMLGV